ncbi:hypothetical protein H2199_005400 [Coniosporium tulheliwenetii]|uniref:Uncharacterized protein n=1 Tax=Coniosporium tulheliwenetii TaxID=3383036 RepID=A0ACC2Z250_9PEZI|nr:hypothetical protein H2199_005400 [Cladosporium sp. JES 115]
MSGHLSKYSPAIRERFLSAKSVPEITKLMEDFKAAVAAGNEKQQGWPSAAYAVSKAGIIGMTRAVAEEEKDGYDEGGGAKTPDQGAQTPVMLAIGDIGGKTGLFWQNEKVIEW